MNSETTRPTLPERLIVPFTALLLVLLPPVVREFYPFSSFHVFVDNPKQYSYYEVETPSGQPLPLVSFGLHRNYIGNGGYNLTLPGPHRGGAALPPCLDLFGQVADSKTVKDRVRGRLERGQSVRVRQIVIGPTENQGVGVLSDKSWMVTP